MDQYIEYIRSLAKDNKNHIFYNTGDTHASHVMSTIFDNAQSNIKIFAGNFSGHVSGSPVYLKSLMSFLDRGGFLQVLLESEPNMDSDLIAALRFYKFLNNDQVVLKIHSTRVVEKKNGPKVHFTIADKRMYRLENDTEKFAAECNFNDETKTDRLSIIFSEIFDSSEAQEIDLFAPAA